MNSSQNSSYLLMSSLMSIIQLKRPHKGEVYKGLYSRNKYLVFSHLILTTFTSLCPQRISEFSHLFFTKTKGCIFKALNYFACAAGVYFPIMPPGGSRAFLLQAPQK